MSPWQAKDLRNSLRRDLAGGSDSFIVPHLVDVEVASALRKLVAGQRIDSHDASEFTPTWSRSLTG
jgi:hypothetical protein